MGLLEDLKKKAEEAKKSASSLAKDVSQTVHDIKNSPKSFDINPFDDGRFDISIGDDKSPINIGIEGGREVKKQPLTGFPITGLSGEVRARVSDFGAEVGFDTNDITGLPDPVVNIQYPDPITKERQEIAVGESIVGVVKDIFTVKPTNIGQDEVVKRNLQKRGLKLNPNQTISSNKRPGGFTIPKGVLAANEGIYAAVLNGQEGFLDKRDGKFYPYDNLSPEQRARLASDFIDLPTLVQYVPKGAFTGKDITLPEIKKVVPPTN